MTPHVSFKARLNRLVNAFPKSISYPYGEQAIGQPKPMRDVWAHVGKNHG